MAGLSFQEAEKIIKESPKEADALAFEYQQFTKSHQEEFPTDIPESVLNGKAISEAYSYLREQHEDSQMQKEGSVDLSKTPQDLAVLPVLAALFLERPKIVEDDKDYQRIEEKLKKDWLEKNPGKDFLSKEGIDYLYGSLDDKTKTSMRKEAEDAFRNNPKFKRRIERYDKERKKIYKNSVDDPTLSTYEATKEAHLRARLKYLKTHPEEWSPKEFGSLISRSSLREFSTMFPEKTKAYHERIKTERENQKEDEEEDQSNISSSDIERIFEELGGEDEIPEVPQETEAPSGSPTSQGRGVDSNIGRPPKGVSNFGKNASKTASRAGKAAAQTGKAAAQAIGKAIISNPYVLLAIVIIVVIVVIVFAIVYSKGKDKYSTQQAATQPTNSSVIVPPAP